MPLEIIPFFQQLIRFNTTNPPGNERASQEFIAATLAEYGFESRLVGRTSQRANLITRLPGSGDAPPLLLHGHIDVVTTANQAWSHDPFSADVIDGELWGRGALDMKSGVAMLVASLINARLADRPPAGDLILAIVADEENGCYYGSQYLVEEHADFFAGAQYAIGEFGGTPRYLDGNKYYSIQVAEKQQCRVVITFEGSGGHGARPVRGQAMAKLGRALTAMDENPLPLHRVPAATVMLDALRPLLAAERRHLLDELYDPARSHSALAELGSLGKLTRPLLRHTASPTGLIGSSKLNVIPPRVELHLDGRILPGHTPDDLVAELRAVVGPEPAIEVHDFVPCPPAPDMGLFGLLEAILSEADPGSHCAPTLSAGYTDARFFAQLGIQTYGYLPLDLPPSFKFGRMVHGANERIPVEALPFGVAALTTLLQRYGRV